MSTIRVVRGTATGPTETASYDAALAAAGVHDYNLVPVSSVVPVGATLEVVETAPDLGPIGGRLTVVQGRATVADGTACAGLGWARADDGRGIFYEASGTDPDEVRRLVEEGLAAGRELRDWPFTDEGARYASVEGGPHATAVVLAVYGESDPVL